MGVTYDKCSEETHKLIAAARDTFHPELVEAEVTIDALFADQVNDDGEPVHALMVRGQTAGAKISVTPLADRVRGIADARLVIDRHTWSLLTESRRLALLDHELEHLELVKETRHGNYPVAADGKTKRDDAGRPRLKLRHHDWELTGFRKVVERHAEASAEASQFRAFEEEYGQLCLFGPVAGRSVAQVAQNGAAQ